MLLRILYGALAWAHMLSLEAITNWAVRRGFAMQSSEIYGGFAAVYDMGPLGVELQNAIKRLWWREMVTTRADIVGIDAQIFMDPRVWEASGHVEAFTDPLVDCTQCKRRFRADHVYEDATGATADTFSMEELGSELNKHGVRCPNCGGSFTSPRTFNLLVGADVGVIEGEKNTVWLRGETAQGIYVNALRVAESMRMKPPFGIAQIGKAFRNEITPRDFLFRVREFEQMEMQFFVRDEEMAQTQYAYWREQRLRWLRETIGLKEQYTRYHEHSPEERAHYARAAEDVQFQFPFGWKELEGIHNRGDWDLSRHTEYSGNRQSFLDHTTNEHYIPHIVETSVGVGRLTLAIMANALEEESLDGGDTRMVARFNPVLAPVQVAILPLSKKEPLTTKARELFQQLVGSSVRTASGDVRVQYDETQSIGKRYRRQDEIGTPLCVTVDFDSLEDNAVTVRDRDSMQQERIAMHDLGAYVQSRIA